MMAHVNPALWIARIMITWSIVTGCMAAISKPWHFYLLRFLLGVFEAGFWPGNMTNSCKIDDPSTNDLLSFCIQASVSQTSA